MYTVICKKCNRKVPTNEVRLQTDKSYVCFACAGYHTEAQPAMNKPFKAPEGAPKAEAPAEKIRVQCMKCKYEFNLKASMAKKCPYCNSERLEEKKGAAQKLIDMHVNLRDEQ
jgi:Zn finger protein HypA/HybF involved in hydrogenase expression